MKNNTNKRRKTNRKSPMGWRRWEDLNKDLLKEILKRLDSKAFYTASTVCRSWQSACWDISFYWEETLDLVGLQYYFPRSTVSYPIMHNPTDMELMHTLKKIFDGLDEVGCRSITEIIFPHALNLNDEHLPYVAQRSPTIKKLSLTCARKITGKGFARAIRNWRELIEITIGPMEFLEHVHMIKEMGINCKTLKELHIYGKYSEQEDFDPNDFMFSRYTPVVIIDNLPTLKVLELISCFVYNQGLKTILFKHKQLETIYITDCSRTSKQKGRRSKAIVVAENFCFDMQKTEKEGRFEWCVNRRKGNDFFEVQDQHAIAYYTVKIKSWMKRPYNSNYRLMIG